MIGGGRPLLHENLANTGQPLQDTDFQSIFARIASAVTPMHKSSISTNRKFTTRFPMSLRQNTLYAKNVHLFSNNSVKN